MTWLRGMAQEHEDRNEYQGDQTERNKNTRFDVSITGVESLERDQGCYKYLYNFRDCISLEYTREISREYTRLEYTTE